MGRVLTTDMSENSVTPVAVKRSRRRSLTCFEEFHEKRGPPVIKDCLKNVGSNDISLADKDVTDG